LSFRFRENEEFFLENRRKGATILSSIHHHPISQIDGRIYGVAAYYSKNDATQHVVVATHDGTLYEIHWNSSTSFTPPQRLWQFPGIASLGGFFTSDDNRQHVIVATEDGRLHELYFMNPLQVNTRSPLFSLLTTAGPHIGMASFFSSNDGLRHAIVGGKDNLLHEVVWNPPTEHNLATPFRLSDVAGIAGFYDLYVYPGDVKFVSENIIVAMKGGEVYDVRSDSTSPGGGQTTTDLVTTFTPPLVNVAAFVDTDTHLRHVISLDASGQAYDYSYTKYPEQVFGVTPLIMLDDVVDMAAYYSDYDRTNHVILVTADGIVHEVYYV
jgi:hypothetical protein